MNLLHALLAAIDGDTKLIHMCPNPRTRRAHNTLDIHPLAYTYTHNQLAHKAI